MFRPCIDVKDLKVVQLEQGERLALTDERSPAELARIYAQDGLTGGHIIDLQGGPNREVILPALQYHNLQVGGGVRLDNGQAYLDAGATHLIFASAVFGREGIDWKQLAKLEQRFGRQRLVLAPDVRGRSIHVSQWKVDTGIELDAALLERLAQHCDELLIHAIEVEGLAGGMDEDLVEFLATHRAGRIVYAGGANDLECVERLHGLGLDVTIGRAYFSGQIAHDDLVHLNRRMRGEI